MSLIEKQREGAWKQALTRSALYSALTDMVVGRRPRLRLGHIVTVQDDPRFEQDIQDAKVEGRQPVTLGSYAVEVIERVDRETERSMWTTVHDGVSDSWRWWTVDQALLHLIALRHGNPDDRGDAVLYASRVLGFDDFPGGENA
jgi:hypothetical protein